MDITKSKFFVYKPEDLEKLLTKFESYKHDNSYILDKEMKRIKSAHSGVKTIKSELVADENFMVLPNDDSLIYLVNNYLNDKRVSANYRRTILIHLYGIGFINQYYDAIEFPGDLLTKSGLPIRDAIKIDIDQHLQEFNRSLRILESEFPGFELNMINNLKMLKSDIDIIRTAVRNYTDDKDLRDKLEARIVEIRNNYDKKIKSNLIEEFLNTYKVCALNTYTNLINDAMRDFRSIIPSDKHYAIQSNYFNSLVRS